ncbi:cytochrome P450 family protein [Rhexocercosporidium sp. MPI-PUGE-AT-0058]|nr:cytochrome P450 family protein [Rhexocercosporidium sp. MPI-PUGE-AT-0058]
MALTILILLLALACFPVYCIVYALLSPLRSVPGPFWARLTRWWLFSEIYRGEFEKTNIELHKRYGPVVRIAPNEYSIDDPEATKEIYGLGSHFVKSAWYIASGSPDPHARADLFTDLDPKRHATNRRKVASLYSMTNLVQMEPLVNDCTGILVKRFTEFAQRGEAVDMGHWLQCYAFDVIGHVTLANRFGFLDSGEDISGIMSAIDDYLSYLSVVGVFSEWHTQIANLLSCFAKEDTGISAIRNFAQAQLKARTSTPISKPSNSKQGDFLTKLLQIHEEDPKKIDMRDVFATCMTNIGAGSDTTSISLGSVIYHLCKYPNTMRALRKEIGDMEEAGGISNPVTFAETQKMPYLQAVIKEALRVHPATGLPLGRVVPKGGKVIAGHAFPEGSVVGINSWVAHANTDVFGQDAHVFRPERWLESKEKSMLLDKYFFSFGMGSRTCIGKNISLLEMAKLIPQLVRNFDIELEQPGREWKTTNKWFVKQEEFFCRVRVRG